MTSTVLAGADAKTTAPSLAVWLPIAAGVFFGAAYLMTLSAEFSSDGMAFSRLTRDDNLSAPLFFQAEHLLYPFLGWALFKVVSAFGFSGGPLPVLQMLNALAGGVCIGIFAWTVQRLAPERTVGAAIATIALGASFGWWYHSSDAEDQIIANAGILIAFAGAAVARGPVLRSALPTGRGLAIVAGFALAMLVHATSVLFTPVLLIFLLREHGLRPTAVLLFWTGVLVGIPYLIVGVGIHGYLDLAAWRAWVLAAPGQGVWGRLGLRNISNGIQTLAAAAVFAPRGVGAAAIRSGVVQAAPIAAATVLMAAGLVAAVTSLVRRRDSLRVGLVAWVVAFGAFGTYWAPDDFQFWLLILPPLYLLAALSVPELWCAVVVVPLVVWNVGAGVLPRHDAARNGGLLAAQCLGSRLTERDLVIAPGWDWAGDYLPYFTKIDTLSLNDAFVLSAKGDKEAFFKEIDRRIAAVRTRGGSAYVVRLDSLSVDDREFFRRVTGLSPEEIPIKRSPAFTCAGEQVSVVS